MNATTAFLCILCIMTLSLVSITSSAHSETNAASASEGGSLSSGGREKPALRKRDSEVTPGGTPSVGKSKQIQALPDRTQVLEERLRSGLMEKPIAQGEVSDRLNQLYSGSNSPVQERAGGAR
jgi:hypothetical protein